MTARYGSVVGQGISEAEADHAVVCHGIGGIDRRKMLCKLHKGVSAVKIVGIDDCEIVLHQIAHAVYGVHSLL